MRELRLIEILADTAAGLGDPELDPGAIEGVLAEALVRAGVPCDMHTSPAGVEVEWRGRPGRLELAYVNGLVECTRLTLAAVGLAGGHTQDVHGFSLELERAVGR